MKKFAKIISIVAILAIMLGVCSGCVRSDVMTTLYLGVPFAEDSDHYTELQLAVEDINMFKESDFVRIELVSIPEDKKERENFLKRVDKGSLAMMIYDRDELLDKYIEDDKLATLAEIQQVYPACYEKANQFMLDTSTDSDGVNHMLALAGSYQGVFFNEEIFIKYGLSIPKTWEQFTAAIETLKANGITPIAGGFADNGIEYWIDELILMEGGVAEHSYVPKYGVVNSWARAMNDFKALYENGSFNADCMDKTLAESVEMFQNGEAAMILCDSKAVTDGADADKTGVFSLPLSATGKKNIGDIVCDYSRGVYINSSFLKKKVEIIDTLIEFVIDYLNAPAEDFGDGAEVVSWSYPAYAESWTLPADQYTIGLEEIIIDDGTVDLEAIVEDPTVMEPVKEEDTLQTRIFNMLENVTEAGRSLTTEFKTFDYFAGLVRDYAQNGGDAEALLLDATQKEVTAQKD